MQLNVLIPWLLGSLSIDQGNRTQLKKYIRALVRTIEGDETHTPDSILIPSRTISSGRMTHTISPLLSTEKSSEDMPGTGTNEHTEPGSTFIGAE
jgi:hypothetical protein